MVLTCWVRSRQLLPCSLCGQFILKELCRAYDTVTICQIGRSTRLGHVRMRSIWCLASLSFYFRRFYRYLWGGNPQWQIRWARLASVGMSFLKSDHSEMLIIFYGIFNLNLLCILDKIHLLRVAVSSHMNGSLVCLTSDPLIAPKSIAGSIWIHDLPSRFAHGVLPCLGAWSPLKPRYAKITFARPPSAIGTNPRSEITRINFKIDSIAI